MSTKLFTADQVDQLRQNPYVEKVNEKTIKYTDTFREEFLRQYQQGINPAAIVQNLGFDPRVLGRGRLHSIAQRLTRIDKERGGDLRDMRHQGSGRPRKRERTMEEENERLRHENIYLKQQLDFVKKIDFLDRKARWEKARRENSK